VQDFDHALVQTIDGRAEFHPIGIRIVLFPDGKCGHSDVVGTTAREHKVEALERKAPTAQAAAATLLVRADFFQSALDEQARLSHSHDPTICGVLRAYVRFGVQVR
jgi:hypothetical protein